MSTSKELLHNSHLLRVLVERQLTSCKLDSTTSPDQALNVLGLARDLGSLLRSNCTKLSLAARPPKTDDAILACFKDMSEFLPAFSQLCAALDPALHTTILCQRIRALSRYALTGLSSFLLAVMDVEGGQRLNKTGILWEAADDLKQLPGANELLLARVSETREMLGDAVTDLEELAASDLEDDLENLELGETARGKMSITDTNIKDCILKITRIQALLKAIHKRRIDELTSIALNNAIYEHVSQLSCEVDELACEMQDGADAVFIMELEKALVHRVEGLLDATLIDGDEKWKQWIESFRRMWQNAKLESTNGIITYTQPPSFTEFHDRHLVNLEPCLIDSLADDWLSYKTWGRGGRPDYDLLRSMFGEVRAHVVVDGTKSTYQCLEECLSSMQSGAHVYAKDMHLDRLKTGPPFYTCPSLFMDDWLNFKLDADSKDDYRFVYIGSDKSFTGLHKDVVASHSWSTNILGVKIWTMVPPSAATKLQSTDGEQAPNLTVESEKWPNLHQARAAAITVLQKRGQTIFVPSGWYHSVENVGSTISINHNWLNASSLMTIFYNLRREMTMSRSVIADLENDGILDEAGMQRVVQELTLANAGMDWRSFFEIIKYRYDHTANYIRREFRPPQDYDDSIVRNICQMWLQLPDVDHLREVKQIVSEIMQLVS